ncbi:disease resistance RPP13-like protein 4 isoform X1 [Pyrus x bretschneideri]|uniref:disease resistance RPP13-like protein 4 isoform X1 n=1 Tax=Pyrus x bretschneideri TaxID=225117 RepID=UPI00202E0F41|nr:disease resistance RPP13-like protein 4 isoform X1 [Pyrus x bretschneideri]
MTMLVEALVQAVTTQVVSAAAHEAQFCFNFKSELEKMKKWLGKMRCLVVDADKKLKLSSDQEMIKKNLSELREVIYEADNALTDCLIREEEKKKKRFFSCLLPLDPVFPHEMGRRLTKINSDMKDVHDELVKYLSASATADSSLSEHISSSRRFVGSLNPHKTYGLDGDIEKLKGWILYDDEKEPAMNYIGIVGMGGLGKTTLAQQLFNDSQILDHFEKTMWVCVSGNFCEQWILKKLLNKVNEETSSSESDEILRRLINVLNGKSYLIVLDDVWPYRNKSDWLKDLCSKLPTSVGKSSCIIITTRIEDVAQTMVLRNTQIHYHKRLKDEDGWDLFSEYAFRKSNGECPGDDYKDVSLRILKKCGGLPLAIKTLGSLLAAKVDSLLKWTDISKKFHALTTEGENVDVINSLQLSYDELPHTSLKQCLLCVSIYPEDFEIDAEQLIHWWVGEGLVQQKDSKTAIELGYEYLAELVNRCLLEVVDRRWYDGKVYKCKIHDMVRELIIKIAGEEAFCIFNEQGKLMQKHEQNEQKPRWFGISEDMDDDQKELEVNPKLRTFFLMSSPPNNFGKNLGLLESLRVLDLSYSKVVKDSSTTSPVLCAEDLFNYISSLKRLACLNLSGTQIREVPSSIQKLLNLQLLVLNGCKKLVKIHPSIKCLKRLIVLDVGDCPLDCLPKGLGSLCLLQELTGFKVVNPAKTQRCALRELSKLKKLRVLRIVLSADTEISQDEMGILSSLSNLKVLTIDAEECKERETLVKLDGLKMPPNLRELYVRNYHSNTMPNWFHPNVLSELQYLCVENCDIKKLTSDQSTWKHVEGLCLKLLNYEEDGENLMKIMPALRYMEISHCSKFKNLPREVEEQGVWRKQN